MALATLRTHNHHIGPYVHVKVSCVAHATPVLVVNVPWARANALNSSDRYTTGVHHYLIIGQETAFSDSAFRMAEDET